MAKLQIRHLVARPNAKGLTRYYWQPAAPLRAAGWRPLSLGTDQAAAMAKAEELNADVDAWRRGEVPAGAPPAAKARAKKAPAGSVAALIEDYRHSRWWAALAPRTRHHYGWALDAIEAWAGDQPARGITPPAVQAFYAAQLRRVEGTGKARRVVETPAKAAAAVRVLRLLLEVGVRLGYLASNPAARPGISAPRQREPRLWSPEAVAQMVEAADRLGWRSIGTAILLNHWMGQREADVLALAPWQVEQGAIVLTQGKTGRRVALPVHLVPALVARLQAETARQVVVKLPTRQAGQPRRATLLRHDRTGEAWNEHTFRHVFAEVRAAAVAGMAEDAAQGLPALPGLPACEDLRFAELRHTAVTRLHEAGVDELGISGITGHTPGSVRAILDRHYLVRTAKAAEGAFKRRLAAEGEG